MEERGFVKRQVSSQVWVVQRADNAMQQTYHYPVDNCNKNHRYIHWIAIKLSALRTTGARVLGQIQNDSVCGWQFAPSKKIFEALNYCLES